MEIYVNTLKKRRSRCSSDESFTECEIHPSMFLFKINDMLKTALLRLYHLELY